MSKIIINVGTHVDEVCEETYQFPEGCLHPSLVGDMMTKLCGFVERVRPGMERGYYGSHVISEELADRFEREEEVSIKLNTNSEVLVRRVLKMIKVGMLNCEEVELWAHDSSKVTRRVTGQGARVEVGPGVRMVISEMGRLEWRGTTLGFFREAFDEMR